MLQLCLAGLVATAAWMDIRCRKFPNVLFLALLTAGAFLAFRQGHLWSSGIFFAAVSLFAVFVLCPHYHIRAGDMKFFSLLFFFFDPARPDSFLRFAGVFLAGMLVFAAVHLVLYYGKDTGKLRDHVRRETGTIQALLLGQRQAARQMASVSSGTTIPLVAELGVLLLLFLLIGGGA